ncbi:MAG: hypothetical protein QXL67_05095 [Candidatus Bathyarchaeia archaeon]
MSRTLERSSRLSLELTLFIAALLVYTFSNLNHIGWYNHFVYLADAFVHGRLDIQGNIMDYPLFGLDIVQVSGRAYIPFPPMPAVLLVPWVLVSGLNASQEFMTHFVGALNVVVIYRVFRKVECDQRVALALTILFGFGTVHWYAAMIGTTWFYAHVVAVFFTLLAVLEVLSGRNSFLAGIFLGAAALSRQLTMLSTPFFILMLRREGKTGFRGVVKFLTGLSIPVGLYLLYNYVRVGSMFDVTYQSLYELYKPEAAKIYGMFDLNWIPSGLYVMLMKGPECVGGFPQLPLIYPYFRPSKYGMSMLLVTPMFLYALNSRDRTPQVVGCWISVIATSLASLMYFNQGWVQFGYRFSLDFTPTLMLLVARGFRNKLTWMRIVGILYCILINAWGVYWGNVLYW